MNGRLTFYLRAPLRGAFHTFLPVQAHPAGLFNPSPQPYPAVDKLLAWNFAAPRLGATFDLGGDGRTIAKLTYGLYWLPPLTTLGFNVNPNQPVWWELWSWADANQSGVWEPGEELGTPQRRAGEPTNAVDRKLRLPYVREVTARIEREIPSEPERLDGHRLARRPAARRAPAGVLAVRGVHCRALDQLFLAPITCSAPATTSPTSRFATFPGS